MIAIKRRPSLRHQADISRMDLSHPMSPLLLLQWPQKTQKAHRDLLPLSRAYWRILGA
jgi:hypothetical protein